MQPIGGHHFREDGVLFEGDTLDEVLTKLSDYRVNNSAPLGDPEQEILAYYAKNWPFMVDEDEDAKPPEPVGWMNAAWVSYLRKMWTRPATKQITPKEASTRWEVCLKCPHNRQISLTTQEEKEMERKSFMLRKGQNVPDKIGFCALHRWDTKSSVFIEAPAAVSGKLKDATNYPGCWVA